jgi:hypothetical protein
MMDDRWASRDLPVLQAIVEEYESKGASTIRVSAIEKRLDLDTETVQRALRALIREPFIEERSGSFGGKINFVGPPTGDAFRAVGAWPTPDGQLARLVGAFEAAAADTSRPDEERSKFKTAAAWLGSFASQVAINALGGAGGNMLS